MTVTLTIVDATGAETALLPASGYRVLQDPLGFDVPPPLLTIDDYVGADGGALVESRRGPRPIVLPLDVSHPTRVQSRIRELAVLLAGPVSLRWSDGTVDRTLRSVVYEAGLSGDGDVDQARTVVLSLLALDPWWYGEQASAALPIAAPTAFNAAVPFNAAIPFNGGASTSVSIAGDLPAFPVIDVYGPADQVTIGCAGAEWQTAVALVAGDVLTIDTRPGRRGPRLNGAGVDWSLLTEASRLWTLPPGTTSVVVGTVGATVDTNIVMAWEPRFICP